MADLNQKRVGVPNFVKTVLESAKDDREVKPQTRYDNVDEKQLENVMANLKKGITRR